MNFYLNKYGFQLPTISGSPNNELGIIVVIPCYNELNLQASLEALSTCVPTKCNVEVITVINSAEDASEEIKSQNKATLFEAKAWAAEQTREKLAFHFIYEENLPRKHAGVGLARKIGMDEAVSRFDQLNRDGIIVCFDADSLCETNYLIELEKHFINYPKTPGCAIHFEHPIEGVDFEEAIYNGIINYELHLRYYNQGLKYAGLPYAFHTVGSSMAVRSSAYQKQGGMNKRKAGEDFYFIHKIIALGNFTELKTTKVIPSPRISDRVPFGTGKAIGDWVATGAKAYETYAFETFEIIRAFVAIIPQLFTSQLEQLTLNLSPDKKEILHQFLEANQFAKTLGEIVKNSKTEAAFVKRFFTWFDAFKVLKLAHFVRDNYISNQSLKRQVNRLLHALKQDTDHKSTKDQLLYLRQFERK